MNAPNQLPLWKRSMNKEIRITNGYSPNSDVTLFLGDRLDLLSEIKNHGDRAELIVTSPPYNVGKEYETPIPLEDYISLQKETISAALEILSPTGSICWEVGHFIDGSAKSKEAYPLDLILYPIFKDFGVKLRNRIVWHFGHGLHENFRFSGRHETILWFTWDTEDYTFNLDPIRIPQKYPGKRAYSGPKKGEPSGNPKGKNPSDVWDMPNVKSNHVEKTEHPCQFPVGLVERLILGLTNKGDLVVDPYLGVGTTAVASILHSRRCAGSDIESRYLDIAKKRIYDAASGLLKIRPMNKPVYKPKHGSKLSTIPTEWIEDN